MQNYSQAVFSGNQLQDTCQYQEQNPHFFLMGHSAQGQPMRLPVGEQMLSRHMLLLGGIGTGKSNAFQFLIRNVRSALTSRDVVIIFDTKGDYYREFYQPGDIVISNDSRADGGQGPDFWNLFGEVTIDDRVEENILEIAKSFFADKLEKTTQPFFPNAAKDLFAALLLHMARRDQFQDYRNNQALRSTFDTFSIPAMKAILQSHPDLKAMTSYIEDEKSGQTLGVVAELQQMVREIFVGNFRKKGSLSIRQLVRQKGGKVIFVEYDLGIGAMLTPVYRLLIDLALKEALSQSGRGFHGCAPVPFSGRRVRKPASGAHDEYLKWRRPCGQHGRCAGIYDYAGGSAQLPGGTALVYGGFPCAGRAAEEERSGHFRG